MKAQFENIGPVHKAELEIKNLTIIAGANNTGKTYLVYTLYGFLKKIQQRNYFFNENIESLLPFNSKQAAQDILKTRKIQYPVANFKDLAKKVAEPYITMSSDNISEIFSAPSDNFAKAKFRLLQDNNLPKKLERSLHYITASIENDVLSFYLNDLNVLELSSYEEIIPILQILFLQLCIPKLPQPFILSSERFGISLFYKELDFTKNRLVETLQKLDNSNRIEKIDPFFLVNKVSSRYAQPIKDNIDYTRDLEFIQKQDNSLANNKLFNDIKEMLNGSFSYKNDDIRFVSKARKNGKFDIPLHLASSSAMGLSDFYFFLKHVANNNQILIIDEPESHLDTANQIEMARLLARCVNSGLKVIITTHSDYIIKEFNNLIMLSQDFSGKEAFLKEYSSSYGEQDYLKPEHVAAYITEKNSLTRCEIDHLGLNMPNFDDTIDMINQIANELALSVEPS
jgi:ABC-type cobalamin/Fe3+-siderophores transport system ATPase subunit